MGRSGVKWSGEGVGDDLFVSIAAVAHDLKSPLSTIHYLAGLLSDDELTLEPKEQLEFIKQVQQSARRGLQLVEGVSLALDGAQLELDLEPVNVLHVTEDVLNELVPTRARRQERIKLRYAPALPLALAHHGALRSVVASLCQNALKHTSGSKEQVEVRLGQHSGRVSIEVRDNGPAMRLGQYKDMKSRLGKHMHPISARPSDSGLEIMIASKLSAAMKGELLLTRHHKKGVTFAVELQPSFQLSLV